MKSWREVTLQEVAKIERHIVDPGDIENGTLSVGLENIESGGRLVGVRAVDAGELASSKFAFTARHLLYGKLRPYLAKIARPNFSGVCSTDVLPILPGPALDRNYLAWLLLTPKMVSLATSRATGANLPRLSPKALAEIKIPLPPVVEQRRIAKILDKADALRAKRRAALTQLDTLTRSIFLAMFAKELDGPAIDVAVVRHGVPKHWSWELLTDVARLATGHTPDRERSEYWNGEIPWISLTDIRHLDGRIATGTNQSVSVLGIDNSSAVLLPKGTVCFSRTASIGFVTVMGTSMATSQDFVNWVCGPNLDPTYLMWALLAARPRLQALSSGSTHKTIYVRVVEQFRGLVPPIAMQREFARRVAAIDSLKDLSLTALTHLNALFASLQSRAFSAKL